MKKRETSRRKTDPNTRRRGPIAVNKDSINAACDAFFRSRGMPTGKQYPQSLRQSKHQRKRSLETPHHIES